MVSRVVAFTIAAFWIAVGIAVGIVALTATSGKAASGGLVAVAADALRGNFRWFMVLFAGCLVVATLWIGVGARNARTSASLGGQAALIGLAAAMVALLLLLVLGQATGGAVPG
jgi:hypothetical protein